MKLKKVLSGCAMLLLAAGLTVMSAAASDFGFAIDPAMMNGEGSNEADADDAALWADMTMTNDALVETGVCVRETTDDESACVGFLYPGGAAKVVFKGDTWTGIESGTVVGFIRNEYLVYGDQAKEAAVKYARAGVVASWDEVNVFSQASGDSEILGMVNEGDTFPIVKDNGHWIEVGLDDEGTETAFVSEDDVTRVFLLDSAFDIDETKNLCARKAFLKNAQPETEEIEEPQEEEEADYSDSDDDSSDSSNTDYSYTDNSSSSNSSSYTDNSSSSNNSSYTDNSSSSNNSSYTDNSNSTSQPETQAPQPETQAPQTEAPAPETEAPAAEPETQAPQTVVEETPAEEDQVPEETIPEDTVSDDAQSAEVVDEASDDDVFVEGDEYTDDAIFEEDAASDDVYVEDSN